MSKYLITWTAKPDFKLLEANGYYNKFECIVPGQVILETVDTGEMLILDFDLGWVSDMTSVPWYVRSVVPQVGPHVPAVVIHDMLLDMGFPREVARLWLNQQLKILKKVRKIRKTAISGGVLALDTLIRLKVSKDERPIQNYSPETHQALVRNSSTSLATTSQPQSKENHL